jgi:two-component system, OmpR family, sensor histidine kinase SenX3
LRRRSTPGRGDSASTSAKKAGPTSGGDLDVRRLVGAVDALADGLIVVDAAGNEVMRNEAAERFRDARHGDALAEHAIGGLLESALHGVTGEEELSLFGPPREVLVVRAAPVIVGGSVVGATAFVRDITEARRVESVRRDFVANVSHELKTPIGALGVLAETIGNSDDLSVVQPLAAQLVREADRLARIVDDLLDLSLIEALEVPTREQLSVRVLLGEAADRLGPLALTRGIPLRVDEVDSTLAISSDPAQVVSALTNLLDNAVKYSEHGQAVELGAERDGERVVIWVRDHGIGIPSTDLERIFERFYRVDRARSRATGGTGLGLSIVRHVAQAHGGDVSVESVEGEGSTFRLFLPLVNDPSPLRGETVEAS